MDEQRRQATSGEQGRDDQYAPTNNPTDPNEHRHGDVVHSHTHTGAHEHGDDYEYDEAHDPDDPRRNR